jgi:hypothetical protein
VISAQSGASHAGNSSDNACGTQPVATVNNYFGSAFDAGGGSYHRLLVTTKNSAVTNVLAANTPFYNQALIIVNTTYYGGAGGQYAVSSLATSASEIAIHEVGHSFPKLADEYWAGSQYASDTPANMTSNGNASTVKWKLWNGVNTVGVYAHSGASNWFKPTTNNCKMEVLGKTFCPVCIETHIEKIHSLVKPYNGYAPANTTTISISNSDIPFSVDGILPIPNTLKIEWLLNGSIIKNNSPNYILSASSVTGTVQLQARLTDTTSLVRLSTHPTQHVYLINWTVQEAAIGMAINSYETEMTYVLSSNPLTASSFIRYELKDPANIELSLVDVNGRVNWAENNVRNKGTHTQSLNPEKLNLASGIYFLQIKKNGLPLLQEKVIVN